MVDEETWYSQLREQWKPEHAHLLLIAESAPDDRGDPTQRHFFYADHLGRADNLFRSVVQAMYGTTKEDLKQTGKRPWLERLRSDGFYLIDLAPYPVNAGSQTARTRVLRESVAGCVTRAHALNPDEVVVVKSDLYLMLDGPLRAAGLSVPQDTGIPFPLGNKRAEFVSAFNDARRRSDEG
ncbi:hypothetical protein [Cryobacterium sp. PH31-O1]|uniref:hypothetical protein n=1 Tax=Cryobacterium sp. PH31-O1 TaxID=3046306 RepID=UPI0024B8C0D7|nr:hypothetical protein [Cryobacterium sp. PH31-O1]MDJ0338684.1 hypothetical protein [Cryobacterium sp. PH31-O1]